MDATDKVTLSLPRETLARLEEFAAAERRNRSNAAVVLIERALAANQRPASDSRAVSAPVQEHLRRHAELSGFPQTSDSQESDTNG